MKNKLYFTLLGLSLIITVAICTLLTIILVFYTYIAFKNASIIAFISTEWWY